MSTAKFEKLIDLIINEDQERAEQLFHEIVVEKSREIYENIMAEESLEEDQVSGLMDEIEVEEEGMEGMMEMDGEAEEEEDGDFDVDVGDDDGEMDMDAEMDVEMGDEEAMAGDEEGEGDLEDRVVDLEDKLDELMAEFEAMMADEEDAEGDEMGGEEAGEEEEGGVMESVQLQKVAAPKHGDDGAQKKSPVAANSGATGMASKPVKFAGDHETPPSSPKAPSNEYTKKEGSLPHAGQFKNSPGVDGAKTEAAPKAKHGDDGANKRSPVAEGKKPVKRIVK
jgi:hypothetical protein